MRRRKRKTVTTPSRVSRTWSRLAIFPASLPQNLTAMSMTVAWLCALWCVAAAGATTPGAAAGQHEKPYALIFGTVWGPDNRPLYGVKVKIRRANEKKARWELYSDHHGEFAQRVPAGRAQYVVSAEAGKPHKSKQAGSLPPPTGSTEVTVAVENDERKDVGLHLKEQQLPRQ
jgi:hypothetical protein